MEGYEIWIFIGILSLATLASFLTFFKRLKQLRHIAGIPTSKIRSASQGYCELKGWVASRQSEPLSSPLSGKPCYWYHITVEKLKSSGKSSSWVTIDELTCTVPFPLTDGTGLCLVDPVGAHIILAPKEVWRDYEYYGIESQSHTPETVMDRFFGSRKYRFTEHLIYKEPELYVLGHFKTTSINDDITHTLSKPDNSDHHFIVGIGDDKAITTQLKWQMVGLAITSIGSLSLLVFVVESMFSIHAVL